MDRPADTGVESESSSGDDESDERYTLWYRDSGMGPVEEEWFSMLSDVKYEDLTVTQLRQKTEGHTITHLALSGRLPKDIYSPPPDILSLLPDIHSVAPNLTCLSVRFAKIPTLESISKLSKLEELVLIYNDLSSPEALYGLSSLQSFRKLDLACCGLKRLPESISQLCKLEELVLRYSDFTASEALYELSSLESLRMLGLASCKLESLPDNISQLSKLEELDLFNSSFSSLEALNGLSSLKSFRKLGLADCGLESLPNSISKLSKLEELDLTGNDLSSPEAFNGLSSLKSLRKLILDSCKLDKSLPESISELSKLEELILVGNDFSSPEALTRLSSLKSLRELDLKDCGLESLPDSIDALQNLKILDLDQNGFKELPASIYKLSNLKSLRIQSNEQLTQIDSAILNLKKLRYIFCNGCTSLSVPPYGVCQQGITVIKQYFTELADSGGVKVTVMPVAVLGRRMAGKTSFIRSLQAGQRTPTNLRNISTPDLDETTRIFPMEELKLSNSHLRFVDGAGGEMYHLTNQFTIRDKCTPCVVVNMSEFHKLSKTNGQREAARKLVFDWIAHVYLLSPSLPSPLLILTHKDLLSNDEFELCRDQLIKNVEQIRHELLTEEKELSSNTADFCKIQHLADTETPLFHPEDTYTLGNDSRDDDTINAVLGNLDARSAAFAEIIPGMWERVRNFIEKPRTIPYIELSGILSEFPGDTKAVLKYLHNIGRIMWFPGLPELSDYVFNDIQKITEMIGVLFDHSKATSWAKRLSEFSAFRFENEAIEWHVFKEMVDTFHDTGIIDKALLHNLMKKETKFESNLAIILMEAFHIIHGPIKQKPRCAYILPYFSTKFMDDSWKTDGELQLRSDILFAGLSPPQYVYQLVSVVLLNIYTESNNFIEVFKNGAVVYEGEVSIYLVHDYNKRKVTVQVSTETKALGSSWRHLLDVMNHILLNVTKVWKATRPVCMFYCAHCLYVKDVNPHYVSNPPWLSMNARIQACREKPVGAQTTEGVELSQEKYFTVTEYRGVKLVDCLRARSVSGKKPTVPQPLRFPTFSVQDDEVSGIQKYLSNLKPDPQQIAVTGYSVQPSEVTHPTENLISAPEASLILGSESTTSVPPRDAESSAENLPPTSQSSHLPRVTPTSGDIQGSMVSHERSGRPSNVAIVSGPTPFSSEPPDEVVPVPPTDAEDPAENLLQSSESSHTPGLVVRRNIPIFAPPPSSGYSLQATTVPETRQRSQENPYLTRRSNVQQKLPCASSLRHQPGAHQIPEYRRDHRGAIVGDLCPVTREDIKVLYWNTEQVYQMTDGVRGRVLIVNIRKFYKDGKIVVENERKGSEIDCLNLERLFTVMGFDVADSIQTDDITEEVIFRAIEQETRRPEHYRHGMFVFILMTHGGSENSVFDSQNKRIYLENIKQRFSPSYFPAMRGKPKMIIVQACSGGNKDFGNIPHKARYQSLSVRSLDPTGQPFLNADDFIVMRAAGESYISKRIPTSGSPFISELVGTFYEHACHEDVETLFKIVQHRVREQSVKHTEDGTSKLGGQIPVSQCTFTNFRKLYMFPRYSPPKA